MRRLCQHLAAVLLTLGLLLPGCAAAWSGVPLCSCCDEAAPAAPACAAACQPAMAAAATPLPSSAAAECHSAREVRLGDLARRPELPPPR